MYPFLNFSLGIEEISRKFLTYIFTYFIKKHKKVRIFPPKKLSIFGIHNFFTPMQFLLHFYELMFFRYQI